MLQITKKITLDFQNKNIVSVNAKQYDKESRYIEITVINQGSLYALDKNFVSAFIRLRKPDSLGVFNSCQITNQGKILVELSEQCLSSPGKANADIVLIEKVLSNGEVSIDDINKLNSPILSTMNFIINITPTALENSIIESSPFFIIFEFSFILNFKGVLFHKYPVIF